MAVITTMNPCGEILMSHGYSPPLGAIRATRCLSGFIPENVTKKEYNTIVCIVNLYSKHKPMEVGAFSEDDCMDAKAKIVVQKKFDKLKFPAKEFVVQFNRDILAFFKVKTCAKVNLLLI